MTIFSMSLSAGVMIPMIVVVRALALHKLPKRTFLALWGVVLCRLTIPFTVPSRFSVYNLVGIAREVTERASGLTSPGGIGSTANGAAARDGAGVVITEAMRNAVSPVTVVWLIGAAALALFFLATHLRCRKDYKSSLPLENEPVRAWLREHPTRRTVEIRRSDKIAAPLTYGIFRPVVLLPKSADRTDIARLRYVLAHEFTHIRRFDVLKKWMLAAALCVHWFNPLVWVMYILANRDVELSCDENVVRTLGEKTKSAYALTLIGLEEQRSGLSPLVSNFAKSAIEERIVSIMKIRKTSLVGILLAVVLVAGTTTAFATSGVNGKDFTEAPNTDGAGFQTDTGTSTDGGDIAVVNADELPAPFYNVPADFEMVGNLNPGQIYRSTAMFAIAEGQPVTFSGSWSTGFQNFEVGLYDTLSGEYTWFSCSGGVLEDYTITADHDCVSYQLAFRNPSENIYTINYIIMSYAVN